MLLFDITFLLVWNESCKSELRKRFSSKFAGIEETQRWATNAPGTSIHKENQDLLLFPAGPNFILRLATKKWIATCLYLSSITHPCSSDARFSYIGRHILNIFEINLLVK